MHRERRHPVGSAAFRSSSDRLRLLDRHAGRVPPVEVQSCPFEATVRSTSRTRAADAGAGAASVASSTAARRRTRRGARSGRRPSRRAACRRSRPSGRHVWRRRSRLRRAPRPTIRRRTRRRAGRRRGRRWCEPLRERHRPVVAGDEDRRAERDALGPRRSGREQLERREDALVLRRDRRAVAAGVSASRFERPEEVVLHPQARVAERLGTAAELADDLDRQPVAELRQAEPDAGHACAVRARGPPTCARRRDAVQRMAFSDDGAERRVGVGLRARHRTAGTRRATPRRSSPTRPGRCRADGSIPRSTLRRPRIAQVGRPELRTRRWCRTSSASAGRSRRVSTGKQ